jgi:hypothetical protein
MFITVTFLAGALCTFMPIAAAAADSAGNIKASDDWQFKAQAYGWLPAIKGTLPTDDDIEITLDEILDSLDFTFMGGIMASRGKWSIVSDVVYLKLSPDEAGKTTIPIGPLSIPTRVDFGADMETWIANLAGSYSIHRTDKHDVQVLAGVRYFSLEVGTELDASVIPGGGAVVDGRDDVWDGIIGLRGVSELSDKWWLNYRFDIGTGGSDLTWNAVAQFGYTYDWGSLVVGYRYLSYDFDSDFKLMKDLDVHGPLIGALWEF